MASLLSNLKVARVDLRPDVVEKSGFVAIQPASCATRRVIGPHCRSRRACHSSRAARRRQTAPPAPSSPAAPHCVTRPWTIATHPHKDAQTLTLRHV